MFRPVVVILDHKLSLPSILVNLVVWCNYFRWFMIVYLGWLVPYKKLASGVGADAHDSCSRSF